jgi:ketosteroid isomerase-like protein
MACLAIREALGVLMHPHAELIQRLYDAFSAADAEGMAACYHAEAHFSDPVFPDLRGAQPGNMWRMLLSRSTGLDVTVSAIEADDDKGKARWEAHYKFGPKQRPVINLIDAQFEFRDGLIVRHIDTFDLWAWSRQALGLPGILLGWSSFLRSKIQGTVAKDLAKFGAARDAA